MTKGISWHYLLLNYTDGGSYYGHTSEHRKELRHNDPEYSKVLAAWKVKGHIWETIWFKIPQTGSHLDKKVHPHLDRCPLLEPNPTRGTNEFFQLINPTPERCEEYKKTVERIVKEVFSGAKRDRVVLNPRYPQVLFRKRVNAAFKSGFKSMLLCAVMRTGKVVMTDQCAVDNNFKVTLVISRRKSPKQSWKDDTEKFDRFENLEYIRVKNGAWKKDVEKALSEGKQVILYATAQYAHKDHVLDALGEFGVDLLVLDEVHLGGKAEQVTKIREYFSDAFVLDVSGTAYDYISDYTPETRFLWSYYDNVRYCTKMGLPYSRINLVCAQYDTEFKKYHPDAPDSITNLFDLNDTKDKLRYPALVLSFINKFLVLGNDPAVLPGDETLSKSNHIYAALPSQKACELVAELIEQSDAIWKPLVCHGDANVTAEDIEGHLNRYSHTICLTVTANVLGVTADWDTIIFLETGESISNFMQMALRASSNPERDALVIDFAAERSLRILREYDSLTSMDSDNDGEVSYLQCINTLGWNTGFKPMPIPDVEKLLDVGIENIAQVIGSTYINGRNLSKIDIGPEFVRDKKGGNRWVHSNANNTGQTRARQVNSSNAVNEDDRIEKKKREQVQYALNRFGKVMLIEQLNGKRLRDFNSILKSSYFEDAIGEGFTPEVVQSYVDNNVINLKSVNRNISDVDVSITNNIEDNLIKALEAVSRRDGVHRPIPERALYGMMEETSI